MAELAKTFAIPFDNQVVLLVPSQYLVTSVQPRQEALFLTTGANLFDMN